MCYVGFFYHGIKLFYSLHPYAGFDFAGMARVLDNWRL